MELLNYFIFFVSIIFYIEQLKSAIIKMLNDDKLASTYGSNAKKRVNEMYSMPSVWKQMTDIWKSVIE